MILCVLFRSKMYNTPIITMPRTAFSETEGSLFIACTFNRIRFNKIKGFKT